MAAVRFNTPGSNFFAEIALTDSNSSLRLYPKERDFEISHLFTETVLAGVQAEVVCEEGGRVREIQIGKEHIPNALAILLEQHYIDEDTSSKILRAFFNESAALQPLAERLAAFVAQIQDESPNEYLKTLIPLLTEYVSNMPLQEIIDLAKSHFKISWVKNAIETKLQSIAQEKNSLVLEQAIQQLEALGAKEGVSHEAVLDDLTQAFEYLTSYNPEEGGLSNELQTRVQDAVQKISAIIPPFDANVPSHKELREQIQAIWDNGIMAKLGLDIPCVFEMNTASDLGIAVELAELDAQLFEHGADGV